MANFIIDSTQPGFGPGGYYTFAQLYTKDPRSLNPPVRHFLAEEVVFGLENLVRQYGELFEILDTYHVPQYSNSSEEPSIVQYHKQGVAIDFTGSQNVLERVKQSIREKGYAFERLFSAGVRGVGIYDKYIHIDARMSNQMVVWEEEIQDEEERSETTPVGGLKDNVEVGQSPNIYLYQYNGSDIELDVLLQSEDFPCFGVDPDVFREVEYIKGLSNNDLMYFSLDRNEKQEYGGGKAPDGPVLIVKSGTSLVIKRSLTDNGGNRVDNAAGVSTQYVYNTSRTLLTEGSQFPELAKRLTNSPGYVPFDERKIGTKKIFPRFQVIVWSRARYFSGNSDAEPWVNISKYVNSINVNVSGNTGSFSLQVDNFEGVYNSETNLWDIKGVTDYGDEYISKTFINKLDSDGVTRRTKSWFQFNLQENDLVFIKFEQLEGENVVDNADPVGQWWDMVGMVREVDAKDDGTTTSRSVTISGNDLSKIFTDEDSYFDAYSIGHPASFFGGELGVTGRSARGIFIEDSYDLKSISSAIEFVLAKIAFSKFIPNEALSRFPNPTTKIRIVVQEDNRTEEYELGLNGIWSLIEFFVDAGISDMIISDLSLAAPNGSVLQQFQKICQMPLVEYFTDTYLDRFFIIVRRPIWDKQSLETILTNQGRLQDQTSLIDYQAQQTGRQSNSLPDVSQRQLGSVESTGGDITQDATQNPTLFESPLIVEIDEQDMISDDLIFEEKGYAWYKITDKNFGNAIEGSRLFPGIYLSEFGDIWGNTRLEVQTMYSDFSFLEDQTTEQTQQEYGENTLAQLRFIIETHVYLPFTRKGSITLNGDRRVKKGNWIYYRPTNELFYVTGVQNSAQRGLETSRNTVVSVERGMVRDYILGQTIEINGQPVEVGYFNLVDLDKIELSLKAAFQGGDLSDIPNSQNFVNVEVFNFFLRRQQFS